MGAKNKKQYCFLDLTKSDRSLEVFQFDDAHLWDDLKAEGLKHPMELNDYDFRVFDSEKKADKFFEAYKKIRTGLSNKRICKSRDLPAMLYKRRYMVQTLMGLKNQTYRNYKKNWKPGQLFNLHDQVFFLTVKLISLTYSKEHKAYCYKFRLAQ